MFERRDVWELSEEKTWHEVIWWYARAVTAMQGRDGMASPPEDFVPSDPTSWRYLAAIHDSFILDKSLWPQGATWNECQHFTWFFLPWHRIYLHYFESVVRQTITDLGGPDDWALPYWDYSDPNKPDVRRLPPAFREPRIPSRDDPNRDDPNPLFVTRRDPAINRGRKLVAENVRIRGAMAAKKFSRSAPPWGFGGPATGWSHIGSVSGRLENTPHGTVHGDVGGLMSGFQTAARDPIFWLHHANIDRLWEVWLALEDRENPTGSKADPWLNKSFKVGGGASVLTLRVREVLNTRQPPLTYFYSNTSLPEPARAAVLAARPATDSRFAEEESVPEDIPPEMVGASENSVPLAATPTEVEVAVEAPSGPALREGAEGAQPRNVYLQVENVRGKEFAANNYMVHVNLPPGADPATDPTTYEDRHVGQVSMFGARVASESDEEHSGSGLTFSFDITELVQRLQEAGEWDPERLRLTFTPVPPVAEQGGDVRAGRVSLFYD